MRQVYYVMSETRTLFTGLNDDNLRRETTATEISSVECNTTRNFLVGRVEIEDTVVVVTDPDDLRDSTSERCFCGVS